MIEITLATIIITIIIVLTLRNTKRAVLENPLILNRTGQYQAILAPKLNIAQTFIETIAQQIPSPRDESQSSSTQCFEVHDPEAAAIGQELYLLAITIRHGLLYFQAIVPRPLINDQDSHFNMLMEAAHNALASIPTTGGIPTTKADESIITATNTAAQKLSIDIKQQLS
ncbi:conserved hypothetical protein [Candidatus Nitrotoga sp. HW29]|uniref:hypothetical protein n=1 Tax=Candidatus Nitrotoga sp. HW29 TaxID=2886963 RepID=UPI001EF34C71|nr:hypothetical protein [Candidatus Nitrotoga sp. HW29]CAH1904579.1 conserved hypothetical protein [Candidatus Nitrotoga sp. HW29]